MLKEVFRNYFQSKQELALYLLGVIVWSATMVRSGLLYPFGMGFWGPNAHDGLWHVALINNLGNFNFDMPTFAGYALQNYHIGFDLLLGLINKLTFISSLTLYFQIVPPLVAFSIGLATILFIKTWKGKNTPTIWPLFFVYFGGSFGYLVSYFRYGTFEGETLFWSQQAISTLINPPYALSLVLLLLGLTAFKKYLTNSKGKFLALTCFIFGLLALVKIYAALLVLAAMFASAVYSLFKLRKVHALKVFLGTLFLALLFYLPFNRSAANLIEFKPFWFLESMMLFVDRLNWPNFYWAFETYKQTNNYLRMIIAYSVAFVIFWYGNMGTRLVAEVYIAKRLMVKNKDLLDVFIFTLIVLGMAVPMLFIQKGTPWNTIQFSYYSLFFAGLLAGVYLTEVSKVLPYRKYLLLVVTVVLLTLPTTLSSSKNFTGNNPSVYISKEEVAALAFLKQQPKGVVLTQLTDDLERGGNTLEPVYAHESTAYVSALSGKQSYFADEVNLIITNFNYLDRKEMVGKFFVEPNQGKDLLDTMEVDYIYKLKDQQKGLDENTLGLKMLYDNSEVIIYRVL